MRNFRKLNIWNDAMLIVKEIYRIAAKLPQEEKYGLKSQICRAAVSIPSNIAEGCSRNSQTEYKRFLEIAIGSAFELETQLEIIRQLKMIEYIHLKDILLKLEKEQKSINSLINKIKNSDN